MLFIISAVLLVIILVKSSVFFAIMIFPSSGGVVRTASAGSDGVGYIFACSTYLTSDTLVLEYKTSEFKDPPAETMEYIRY